MTIIALTGNRGAGKSYLAAELATALDGEVLPLAQPLRDGLRAMFPWLTPEQLRGASKEVIDGRMGTTPRRALQTLGTEWARTELDDEVWLRRWAWSAAALAARAYAPGAIIVDDVRFANEVEFFAARGATFIHVLGGQPPGDHASDQITPYPDSYVVPHRGGLEYLRMCTSFFTEFDR